MTGYQLYGDASNTYSAECHVAIVPEQAPAHDSLCHLLVLS